MNPQIKRDFFQQKVAIFVGYNGKGYCGLQAQKNPLIPTIQRALFDALCVANLLTETNIMELKKNGWSRGARTDKGVHALSNTLNFKMAIRQQYLDKSEQQTSSQEEKDDSMKITRINSECLDKDGNIILVKSSSPLPLVVDQEKLHLPQEIKEKSIESQKELQNSDKKIQQEKIELNQQVSISIEKAVNLEDQPQLKEEIKNSTDMEEEQKSGANGGEDEDDGKPSKINDKSQIDFEKIQNAINANLPKEIRVFSIKQVTQMFDCQQNCQNRLYEYLMPLHIFQKYDDFKSGQAITQQQETAIIARLQNITGKYVGTHNFHNYTQRMSPKDARANRYIISIGVSVVQRESLPLKFVRFSLVGQSFIYHQIRKMIGMVCLIFQNNYQDNYLDNSFFHNHVRIWLAPAEGLYLHRMNFDTYNQKMDIPEVLLFDEQQQIDNLKFRDYLEDIIFQTQLQGKVFTTWLEQMKDPTFEAKDDVESLDGDNGQG